MSFKNLDASLPLSSTPADAFDIASRALIKNAAPKPTPIPFKKSTIEKKRITEEGLPTAKKLRSIPTTPPQTNHIIFHALPATPMPKHMQKAIQSPPFPNELEMMRENNDRVKTLNQFLPNHEIEFVSKYRWNETDHSILQQVTKKGCGPTSLLMLWSDMVRNESLPPAAPKEGFWAWVGGCSGTRTESMIHNAGQYLNISLRKQDLPYESEEPRSEKNFNTLADLIKSSGHSVIASIDHRTIGLHYILIDAVDTEKKVIAIRDPFSGQAYCIPYLNAFCWFKDGTGYCLYNSGE